MINVRRRSLLLFFSLSTLLGIVLLTPSLTSPTSQSNGVISSSDRKALPSADRFDEPAHDPSTDDTHLTPHGSSVTNNHVVQSGRSFAEIRQRWERPSGRFPAAREVRNPTAVLEESVAKWDLIWGASLQRAASRTAESSASPGAPLRSRTKRRTKADSAVSNRSRARSVPPEGEEDASRSWLPSSELLADLQPLMWDALCVIPSVAVQQQRGAQEGGGRLDKKKNVASRDAPTSPLSSSWEPCTTVKGDSYIGSRMTTEWLSSVPWTSQQTVTVDAYPRPTVTESAEEEDRGDEGQRGAKEHEEEGGLHPDVLMQATAPTTAPPRSKRKKDNAAAAARTPRVAYRTEIDRSVKFFLSENVSHSFDQWESHMIDRSVPVERLVEWVPALQQRASQSTPASNAQPAHVEVKKTIRVIHFLEKYYHGNVLHTLYRVAAIQAAVLQVRSVFSSPVTHPIEVVFVAPYENRFRPKNWRLRAKKSSSTKTTRKVEVDAEEAEAMRALSGFYATLAPLVDCKNNVNGTAPGPSSLSASCVRWWFPHDFEAQNKTSLLLDENELVTTLMEVPPTTSSCSASSTGRMTSDSTAAVGGGGDASSVSWAAPSRIRITAQCLSFAVHSYPFPLLMSTRSSLHPFFTKFAFFEPSSEEDEEYAFLFPRSSSTSTTASGGASSQQRGRTTGHGAGFQVIPYHESRLNIAYRSIFGSDLEVSVSSFRALRRQLVLQWNLLQNSALLPPVRIEWGAARVTEVRTASRGSEEETEQGPQVPLPQEGNQREDPSSRSPPPVPPPKTTSVTKLEQLPLVYFQVLIVNRRQSRRFLNLPYLIQSLFGTSSVTGVDRSSSSPPDSTRSTQGGEQDVQWDVAQAQRDHERALRRATELSTSVDDALLTFLPNMTKGESHDGALKWYASALHRLNVTVVEFEGISSLAQQAQLVYDTDAVITVHSAACAWLLAMASPEDRHWLAPLPSSSGANKKNAGGVPLGRLHERLLSRRMLHPFYPKLVIELVAPHMSLSKKRSTVSALTEAARVHSHCLMFLHPNPVDDVMYDRINYEQRLRNAATDYAKKKNGKKRSSSADAVLGISRNITIRSRDVKTVASVVQKFRQVHDWLRGRAAIVTTTTTSSTPETREHILREEERSFADFQQQFPRWSLGTTCQRHKSR